MKDKEINDRAIVTYLVFISIFIATLIIEDFVGSAIYILSWFAVLFIVFLILNAFAFFLIKVMVALLWGEKSQKKCQKKSKPKRRKSK